MPFSRASTWPRDRTPVSHIAGRFFIVWATREAPEQEAVVVPETEGWMFCGTKAVTMTTRVTEIGVQYTRVGEGNGTPLQYSCLENPMDGGAWCAAVHGVARSRIRLSDFTFTFHFHALEKEMATHSSVLAWRIPGTGEPGGLPPMGSHRVGHDWCDLAAVAVFLVVLWFS